MANRNNISRLNDVLHANSHKLAYINLAGTGAKTNYNGWISDFHIYKLSDLGHLNPFFLDLKTDNDLFLLFVLASCWSRTGQFENAAYFTVYLKETNLNNPSLWRDETFVESEISRRRSALSEILSIYEDIRLPERKAIYFRPDFYTGVAILAENWTTIKQSLEDSSESSDYSIFIKKIRSIGGIGGKGPKGNIRIKIPLILRELRVAKRYKDIPGEWCCVPDKRVLDACKNPFFSITFRFPDNHSNNPLTESFLENLGPDKDIMTILNKSQIIYSYFGDLYDIPLFAFPDLRKMGLI